MVTGGLIGTNNSEMDKIWLLGESSRFVRPQGAVLDIQVLPVREYD